MDVSPAGTGSPILDSPVRLNAPGAASPPAAATAPGTTGDTVGPLLQLLSTPQIHDLLHNIDAHRLSPEPAVLDSLLQTAGAAVAHHDVPRALAVLGEYINRNPEHAGTLPMSPPLLPIQGEVKELLRNVTQDARTGAERLIAAASLVVDGAAARHPEGLGYAGVLTVAERFVQSGELVNYIRAAELSQAVLAFYNGAPPNIALAASSQKAIERRPLRAWTWALWRRVPVLVLLAVWFALGLAGSVFALLVRLAGVQLNPLALQAAFELWGVGFLALVLLQFWISVRGFR